MMDETSPLRRRPRKPGPLAEEVRHLLAGIGLPGSDTDERDRAHGIVVTDTAEETVLVEWFASRTLRATAAVEQREAICQGPAALLHHDGRRLLHQAIASLLHGRGDMRATVLAERGVQVWRTRQVEPPEEAGSGQPPAVGEVLAAGASPMRGFLIDGQGGS